MAESKMCPHCGSKMFAAAITRPCIVEVTNDKNNPFKILKEVDNNPEIAIAKCARCRAELTEADLVTGVKCNECGKIVSPGELTPEGICDVCDAIKKRSELATASKEELIKMLLNAEKNANPVAAKIEKKIQDAEETVQQIELENTQPEEQKKPRTRAKVRGKKDSEPEVVETSITETENAMDDLANSQEAPFPEMNAPEIPEVAPVIEPAPAVVDTPLPSEQAIGVGFEMFPTDEAF